MATTTTKLQKTSTKPALTEQQKKANRSAAAKKAAETRKRKKLEAEQQKQTVEIEQTKEAVAEAPKTIAAITCEVLLKIDPTHPKQYGYPYTVCLDMILAEVRKTRPDAAPTIECLRWYASKMRNEGIQVPYRPHASPKKT